MSLNRRGWGRSGLFHTRIPCPDSALDVARRVKESGKYVENNIFRMVKM